MKRFFALAALLALSPFAIAQSNVTCSVAPATADMKATPTVTWSSTPAGAICTATQGWSGARSASGALTLAQIVKSTSYGLSCSWPAVAATGGTTTVTWLAPTTNTDGTPITVGTGAQNDLAGWRILSGTSPTDLSTAQVIDQQPNLRTWISPTLAAGTYYFGVKAVNAGGLESDTSNIATKQIVGTPAQPASSASCSATITIKPAPMPPVLSTVSVVNGAPFAPLYRVNPNGTLGTTFYGLVPAGRDCTNEYVATFRGKKFYRVTPATAAGGLWYTSNATNLAAPCA